MVKKKHEEKEEEEKIVMPTEPTPDLAQDSLTKELLEKNLKWSQLIYEQNKKIQRRLTLMVIGSYLKLLLVLVPLILAAIYLPPLVGDAMTQYKELLGGGNGGELDLASIIASLSEDQIKLLLDAVSR